jgi:hypothetical protein
MKLFNKQLFTLAGNLIIAAFMMQSCKTVDQKKGGSAVKGGGYWEGYGMESDCTIPSGPDYSVSASKGLRGFDNFSINCPNPIVEGGLDPSQASILQDWYERWGQFLSYDTFNDSFAFPASQYTAMIEDLCQNVMEERNCAPYDVTVTANDRTVIIEKTSGIRITIY